MLNLVLHRQREVLFSVKCTRDQSDRAARHQFANEDDATAPGVGGFFAHIKAQVHFLEVAMQRNGKTEQTSIEK